MEQAKLVGVGYMGRADRVSRLLSKVMENTNLVPDFPGSGIGGPGCSGNPESVTGFYLGYTETGLELSLTERSTGPRAEKIHHRITRSVKQQRNRLH
jgi:hypothetical protein